MADLKREDGVLVRSNSSRDNEWRAHANGENYVAIVQWYRYRDRWVHDEAAYLNRAELAALAKAFPVEPEVSHVCACPTSCDCQDEPRGLVSNECPIHNITPSPSAACPVHGRPDRG